GPGQGGGLTFFAARQDGAQLVLPVCNFNAEDATSSALPSWGDRASPSHQLRDRLVWGVLEYHRQVERLCRVLFLLRLLFLLRCVGWRLWPLSLRCLDNGNGLGGVVSALLRVSDEPHARQDRDAAHEHAECATPDDRREEHLAR